MSQKLNREQLIDMAQKQYFANVDKKDLQAVTRCFNEDAVFTIQSSFTVHEGREDGIKGMFERLFENHSSILHSDFETIADPEGQSVSSRFRVELNHVDGSHVTLMNVNHWYLKDGKFQRVFVWMSGENVLK